MSKINPIHLAQAIVHWLEYQNICGRSELFCEAYLAQPIGEYCLSLKPEHFEPELPYPPSYQRNTRRKRSLDFAVFGKLQGGAQKFISDAIEAKFVTAKRDFTQEAYDDLYRLLWFQPTREPARCSRWFIVAGFKKNLHSDNFLDSRVQLGRGPNKPKTDAFTGLLSSDLNNHTRVKPIHAADPRIRPLWVESAHSFGQTQLPDSITVRLAARAPRTARPTDACCYIWEIQRPQPNFLSVHPC